MKTLAVGRMPSRLDCCSIWRGKPGIRPAQEEPVAYGECLHGRLPEGLMKLWRWLLCRIKGHVGFEVWEGDYPGLNGWESQYAFVCERCGKRI